MAAQIPPHPATAVPLEEGIRRFLEYLERERRYSSCTVDSYRSDLRQFARFLYPRLTDVRLPLAAIRPELIAAFLEELRHRGLRPDSLARKLSAIRSCFRYLVRSGVASANPAGALEVVRTGGQAPAPLSLAAVEEALTLPTASPFRGARDRAILEALYGGGICLAELVGLNLTALDLDRGTVRVTGRGRRERAVPIGGPAVAAMRQYLKQRAELLIGLDIARVDAGALFVNGRGRRLDRRTVQRLVHRRLSQVVSDGQLSPRTLRHTYTIHLLEAGADAVSVTGLLGRVTPASVSSRMPIPLDRLREIYALAHPRADGDAEESEKADPGAAG
ncbi:MAG: tyrosine-type recombinase/integrase [Candidatus Latescibacterota bacterium]|jgi:integrase/recombinase XerC